MLTIYSASAGTGKTHTLTGEYLKLLFKGSSEHRRILAVTFTNKATAEMKGRIVEELFKLADGQPSDYIGKLSANGQKNENDLRRQAQRILINILHDYSSFNISTIDHFFQRTIRAFTREIGLQGNYQIELDEDIIMDDAVTNMLGDLEKSDNKPLLQWLLQFMDDKIEDSKDWKINDEIKTLGKELFKETYKKYGDEIKERIEDKQFLNDYLKELYKIIQAVQSRAKELGKAGVELLKKYDLYPSDLRGGSKSQFFLFEKLAGGEMKEPTATFIGFADNLDAYTAKTASIDICKKAEQLYNGGMNDLVKNVIVFFDNLTDYNTAVEIKRNFYALGIFGTLSKYISEWREENNKMLIADTTELLNKVINGSEVPFIYEKTGTRIDHYMIDEFQDTSRMQWANFRPLLKDSLDNGRANLIVGDVKQSIYRFRNSDWTLLESQIKQDFKGSIVEKSLDTNWRSFRNIVEFNNMLFERIPTMLQASFNEEIEDSTLSDEEKKQYISRIISAYENAAQNVAKPLSDKQGHVKISFLQDNDDKDWKSQSMEMLPKTIEQLQDNGYELRDIAILTRTGNEGLLIAETLLEYKESHPDSKYKYDIISEDSLTINSSLAVRWMIAMMRYLNQPTNTKYLEMAKLAYSVMYGKKTKVENGSTDAEKNDAPFVVNDLQAAFTKKAFDRLENLLNRSLYELSEGLFRAFENEFPKTELVFIHAFLDIVAEYAMSETADTSRFLEWWDEKGATKKIATPDTQNAIRIMTIHKAKGLGFKVVVIPFAEWKIDQKSGSQIWCCPEKKPFDAIKMTPIKYGGKLSKTIFARDYFNEKLNAYMDNLNTLYVAFTRAKEELIVVAHDAETKSKSITTAKLLWNCLFNDADNSQNADGSIYERGTWQKASKNNIDDKTKEIVMEQFHSVSPDERMQLRLSHNNLLFDDGKRKYGILMHDILHNIATRDDIETAVAAKSLSGEISSIEAEILKTKLASLLTKDDVKEWFDGSNSVMNEVEILYGKGQSRRPDRIMIDKNRNVTIVDYKSGDKKSDKYKKQMEKYCSLIREMGYLNVSGYIWYLTLEEMEKI